MARIRHIAILTVLLVSLLCGSVFAQEVIASYDESSLPILNEELRKLQESIDDVENTFEANTDESVKVSASDDAGYLNEKVGDSVTVSGNNIKLVGDSSAPGNLYIYGTDSSGTKGWQTKSGGGDYVASDDLIISSDFEKQVAGGVSTKIKIITSGGSGTFRIKWDIKMSNGTAHSQLYNGASPVGSDQTTLSVTYVTKSQDIAGWSVGDTFELWCHRAFVTNFRIYGTESQGIDGFKNVLD